MRTIRLFCGLVLLGAIVNSCIERYFPEQEGEFASKLVISAFVAADDGDQDIVISRSSSPEKPELIPEEGCQVFIEDEAGNLFFFYESPEAGHYKGKFEGEHVVVGSKYRLTVVTSSGSRYQSRFEELMPCPELESVYYQFETHPTIDPGHDELGLQFLLDFNADDRYGNFFRWQLIETYEYHSTWPLDKWLDVDGYHDEIVPDYSNFTCYDTDTLGDIFVLSTKGFSANQFRGYKLHYVNDETQRLQHRYSLLVRQMSLTEEAYNFWENLRKNNQESVDLFGKQPANVKGNIRLAKDTTQQALGFFSVSAVREKRIMVDPVKELKFDRVFQCRALIIDGPLTDERPLYFAKDYKGNGEEYLGIAAPDCIFCKMLGGTTEKPAYWDEPNGQ